MQYASHNMVHPLNEYYDLQYATGCYTVPGVSCNGEPPKQLPKEL